MLQKDACNKLSVPSGQPSTPGFQVTDSFRLTAKDDPAKSNGSQWDGKAANGGPAHGPTRPLYRPTSSPQGSGFHPGVGQGVFGWAMVVAGACPPSLAGPSPHRLLEPLRPPAPTPNISVRRSVSGLLGLHATTAGLARSAVQRRNLKSVFDHRTA